MTNNNDVRDSLKDAKRIADGKGFIGWLSRIFLGRGFGRDLGSSLKQAEEHLNREEMLGNNAAVAQAEVLTIKDTGLTIQQDPQVDITLKMQPAEGEAFETKARTVVSKVAVPRVGDTITVRYNPDDPTKLVVVS